MVTASPQTQPVTSFHDTVRLGLWSPSGISVEYVTNPHFDSKGAVVKIDLKIGFKCFEASMAA